MALALVLVIRLRSGVAPIEMLSDFLNLSNVSKSPSLAN
jgi:hypothetical protein